MSTDESYHRRGGLSGRREELLLAAALLPDSRAPEAWARWEARARGAPRPSEERLLPLVAWNLARLGAPSSRLREDALARAHAANRDTLGWSLPALAEIARAAQAPVVMIKGVAMALGAYPSSALRPIGDVDILLPPDAAERACAFLASQGWRRESPVPESARRHLPSEGFIRADGLSIDVHRAAAAELAAPAVAGEILARARGWDIHGIPARRLAAEDEFLLACLHGLHWRPGGSLHWAADAVMILRGAGEGFDWRRLAETARRARCRFSLRLALRFLRDSADAPVPEEALACLRGASAAERLEHRLRSRRPALLRGLLLHAFDHARSGGPRGFRPYLRDQWGVAAGKSLAAAAAGRAARRLRAAIRR